MTVLFYEHFGVGQQSNGSLGVHTQHKFVSFPVEYFFDEIEMWKAPYTDEKSDVALSKFEHRSILRATAQQTTTGDRPRLSATVVFVIPDNNSL